MFFHFTQDASNGATGAFVAIESDERSKKRPGHFACCLLWAAL